MTPGERNELADRLCEGLRAERSIYESLASLGQEQARVLAEGKTDEILTLARCKEAELSRIARIEEALIPLKEAWSDHVEEFDADVRETVESEIESVKDVLRSLIELENRGQQGFQELRRETSESLKSVDGGRKMKSAYSRAAVPSREPRFIDRTE